MKTSIINTISIEALQKLINTSSSFKEVLLKLGKNANCGTRLTLNARIRRDGLDISDLENKRREQNKCHVDSLIKKSRFKDSEVFVEDSTYNRSHIKDRILKHDMIEYKCEKCGNIGEWNGEILSLQLDHINGVSNDHRIKNLRFLCPNCHSQTSTFGSKTRK